jgi:transposase
MEGLAVIRAVEQRKGAVNEYAFLLDDPEDRWETLFTQFANSESQKFDSSVRALKKLCKRNSG